MKLRRYLKQISTKWNLMNTTLSSMLLICASSDAAVIPIGSGGYTTDLPPGRMVPSDRNNNPATPRTAPGFAKAPQTNQWWSSLIWKFNPESPWSESMFAHPLSFKAQTGGLEVGYPTSHFVTPFNPIGDGTKAQEYHYPHVRDLLLGISGLSAPDTKVSDYSDWAVTAYWSANGKTLQTTFGSGLPFVYVTQAGGDAIVNLSGNPTIWSNNNGVVGVTVNGHHYGIFAPAGSSWTRNGNNLQSNLSGKNYYSVALLPDNQASTLEFFRARAYAFVTDTKVSWKYDPATSLLTSTYAVQSTLKEPGPNNSNINHPVLALNRHQWLNSKDPVLGFSYSSAHGSMKVVDASQFTTSLKFSGVLPALPNFAKDGVDSYNSTQLYGYIDGIFKQSPDARWNINDGTDSYWMGKALAKIAHLVPIAEQVKHTAARDLFLAEIKTRLQNWLDGTGNQLFYYNNNWRTLIGYPASYGSDNNLNDHHFHYGYFVMAAACVAHYDPSWAQNSQWGGMINLLIKDCTNADRSDQTYPFLRMMDVYAGHGWASGAANFASGNNLESSSEEIDYDSALILWGSLTGNTALRDLGIFLYATATSAIPQYWFDVDNQVFPSDFQPNTLGMVWSDGGAYATWFGGPAQFFHGINFLPINPGMLYLGRYPDYLKANQTFMLNNGGAAHTDVWRDIHMSVKALYDPLAAITEFNQNQGYGPEAGDSKAHTYHWIHNVNQLGRVDTSITADTPTYAVFNKNGVRNHVAYNPNAAPIVVTFSDGVKLTVASHEMATDGQTPQPPTHSFTDDAADAGEVVFTFKPNWSTQYVKFNYKINGGALQTVAMTSQNSMWQYTVHGLKSGDTVDYYYTYEDNNKAVDSSPSQHVYRCGVTPPEPGPGPGPLPIFIDQTDDFKLTVQPTANSLLTAFTSSLALNIVDIHYKVNNGNQVNLRMQKSGTTWTNQIDNLKDNDVITFNITYINDKNVGHDTRTYTYQFLSVKGLMPVSHSMEPFSFNHGMELEDEFIKFWFAPSHAKRFVDVHYQLEDGSFEHDRMSPQGEQWEYRRPALSTQPIVDYFFSYENGGLIEDTAAAGSASH
ncbi:conserved putative secreted protein [Candidatus Protochlamydia naegleriophila]|uniref:glucan endo-1,3-beta-D-glucosidase n=1 Tax=Candidatus Protochlamydia naegleriophila TaxID=389348 RepID=A0A0U5EUB7_9BACT|nr:glycosyl hydrolase [Candidatus Protochlamydia naegleriophila]CUI17793.1 conserved putative secreted protein [Candidatus Protochlamydia naegleriophila]